MIATKREKALLSPFLRKLLVQLCGRGDFLRRWRRVQLVREVRIYPADQDQDFFKKGCTMSRTDVYSRAALQGLQSNGSLDV